MTSITQVSVVQPMTVVQSSVTSMSTSEPQKTKENEAEISEDAMWQSIEKIATPILKRNFQEECKNGVSRELIASLYKKRDEIKQLDLAELDLEQEHLKLIARLFLM